jgi:hypothetical protein
MDRAGRSRPGGRQSGMQHTRPRQGLLRYPRGPSPGLVVIGHRPAIAPRDHAHPVGPQDKERAHRAIDDPRLQIGIPGGLQIPARSGCDGRCLRDSPVEATCWRAPAHRVAHAVADSGGRCRFGSKGPPHSRSVPKTTARRRHRGSAQGHCHSCQMFRWGSPAGALSTQFVDHA